MRWLVALLFCLSCSRSSLVSAPEETHSPPAGCSEVRAAPALQPEVQGLSYWMSRVDAEKEILAASALNDFNLAYGRAAEATTPLTTKKLLSSVFSAAPCGAKCASFFTEQLTALGLRASAGKDIDILGSFSIDLVPLKSERERDLFLDMVSPRGVVVLILADRALLYLGRDDSKTPMAFSPALSLSEKCGQPSPSASGFEVRSLKSETPKGSLLSQVLRVEVFGVAPGPELAGVSALRPNAPLTVSECKGQGTIFVSPRTPNEKQPLRIIATSSEDPGPVSLLLRDPTGAELTPKLTRFGGPPYAYVATIDAPAKGEWQISFGEGSRLLDCTGINVSAEPPKASKNEDPEAPSWAVKRQWSAADEDLYAAFVESLFSYPIEEDLTWKNLQSLLRDQEKNLLYNHLSMKEEEIIVLEPDCAELPTSLRAYFAWKMGLPYGFRLCDRGKSGRPPECEDLQTNLIPREAPSDVKAFVNFVRRQVMVSINSGGGRTHPDDSKTDYYPVALTRSALRPGTAFGDPYGHVMIIAGWVPQSFTSYGILMGADAQPDGTIARRRFWRGSFLFSSDTKDVGAGFKAFRPVIIKKGKEPYSLSNKTLQGKGWFRAFSKEQYKGSTDDWYDTIDALINPRPLEASGVLGSLVEALGESVSRRVTAVQNGEDYMIEKKHAVVPMPKGYSIFETSGPWEDFATPSRDMRLLISIDTVLNFPDAVKRQPARYGLSGDVSKIIEALSGQLDSELKARSFSYQRSDGSSFTLTLKDVIERRVVYEVGYNPNDCPEYRWGAPEGSEEHSTCKRRAPKSQQALLLEYQDWFTKRQRPPR